MSTEHVNLDNHVLAYQSLHWSMVTELIETPEGKDLFLDWLDSVLSPGEGNRKRVKHDEYISLRNNLNSGRFDGKKTCDVLTKLNIKLEDSEHLILIATKIGRKKNRALLALANEITSLRNKIIVEAYPQITSF